MKYFINIVILILTISCFSKKSIETLDNKERDTLFFLNNKILKFNNFQNQKNKFINFTNIDSKSINKIKNLCEINIKNVIVDKKNQNLNEDIKKILEEYSNDKLQKIYTMGIYEFSKHLKSILLYTINQDKNIYYEEKNILALQIYKDTLSSIVTLSKFRKGLDVPSSLTYLKKCDYDTFLIYDTLFYYNKLQISFSTFNISSNGKIKLIKHDTKYPFLKNYIEIK